MGYGKLLARFVRVNWSWKRRTSSASEPLLPSIIALATGFLPLTDAPTPGGEWQPFGLPIPWKEYERGCRHILEHSSTDSSKLTIPTAKALSLNLQRNSPMSSQTTDAPPDVKKLLGPNEHVELYINQKIYHPTIKVDSVVLTNERIILRHPYDLGLKKDYTDYSYTDIANVVMDKGLLRSSIQCVLRFKGEALHLKDLQNDQAATAYGIIRENLVRYQNPMGAGYAGVPPIGVTAIEQNMAGQGLICKKCGVRNAASSTKCSACGSPL